MKRSLGREVHGAVRSSRKTATSSLSLDPIGSSGSVSSVIRLFPFPPKSLLYAYGCEHTCFGLHHLLSFCGCHFPGCPLWSAAPSLEHRTSGTPGMGRAQAQFPRQGNGGALRGILVAGDISPTMAHSMLFRLFFNILELHLKPIRLFQQHLSLLQLHSILSHYSSDCSLKLCRALKSQLSAFVCLDL